MRKLAFVLVVLTATVAAACGGGDDAEEAAPTIEPAAFSEPTSAATAAPAAAEQQDQASAEARPTAAVAAAGQEPQDVRPQGGTFRRLGSDPPTLDPHLTTDTDSAAVVVEIFSGLVALNTNMELIPDLAESWEISGDGRVYTFRLRPNARFHDGKRVTAHDFKWSLERASDPDTASPVAHTYLGDIVGAQAFFDGEATEIIGIRVVDDQTIQIAIDAPKAYFLAKLTYPTAFVLDRKTVEPGGAWTDNPNGTGPFKLAEYRIGERIVLERNENFYREPAYLDRIHINLAGGQSMAMYENDEIDITGVGLFDLDRVLDPNDALNRELVVAPPEYSIFYVGFNTEMAPFDDVMFRQALNRAVDKELIASEVFSGVIEAAYGILPPGFPGYNPNLEGLTFDPVAAKQLLSESRYADPDIRPRIVVTVPGTGGTIGPFLEIVIEMWRQILEVEVEIQQMEWATFLGDLNQSKFQVFAGLGWEADYPDPQDFLDILFHSESQLNHGRYSNAEVDRLVELARIEQDVVKRIELYHRAEQLIVDDGAWLPLYYTGNRYTLVKSHVKGYKTTPMILPKLREVYVEE